VEEKPGTPAAAGAVPSMGQRTGHALLAAGVLGLLLWGTLTPFSADAPALGGTRASAVEAARAALEERGVSLDDSWRTLPSVAGDVGLADRFVWQEGGPETYRAVIGSHIEAPHWQVRYARFEGDVVERAEERLLHVDAGGRVVRAQHVLPEGRAGASLSGEEAREAARAALEATLELDPSTLREVSAEPAERPSRRDWAFVFQDPAVDVGGSGQARIAVSLAGDEVVDVFRHVHVPEDWQRAEIERATLGALVSNVCGFPLGLGLLAGAVAGLVAWSRGRFARGTFGLVLLGLAGVMVARVLNAWPVFSASFDTARPWTMQAVLGLGGGIVGAGFFAALLALVAGFVHRWLPAGEPAPRSTTLLRGAALGAAWAGLAAAAAAVAPSLEPLWPALASAGSAVPALDPALESLRVWATQTLILMLLVGVAGRLSRGGSGREGLAATFLVVSGLVLSGAGGVSSPAVWLVTGLATGVILYLSYRFVLRLQPALLPVATAVMAVLALAREAVLNGYPGAPVGAILGLLVVGALGTWWSRRLEATAGQGAEPAPQ
jgi:hypothetical protein